MRIEIIQGHDPPHNPDGITVVIDVVRAFTTAWYAFDNGVRRIWPVATAHEAFALEREMPGVALVGEQDALPIPGFDYGNSPLEIHRACLPDALIMRTTNGVRATLNSRLSRRVLVCGLVNAAATVDAIQALATGPDERVVLVASHPVGDEDLACAEYMLGMLDGPGINLETAMERVRRCDAAEKFLKRLHPRLHPEDIHMAAESLGGDAFAMEVSFRPRPVIRRLDWPIDEGTRREGRGARSE